MACKLRDLKVDLEVWNEVFGNVERKKASFGCVLQVFEGLEEKRGLSEEAITRKAMMINDLMRTTLSEDVNWRQKLRALLLKRG